jgi:G patch domain/KOW motif-containing protein
MSFDSDKPSLEISLKHASKRPRLETKLSFSEASEKNYDTSIQSVRSFSAGKMDGHNEFEDPLKRRIVVPLIEIESELPEGSKYTPLLAALQKAKSQQSESPNSLHLAHHADDINVSSSAYENVPVEDFGAALLRGMGWNGNSENETKSSYKEINPRKKGLGLGAKLIGSGSSSHLAVSKRQRVIAPSDIVRMTTDKETVRAIVVQTSGVPGLNKIRIKMENSGKEINVDKGSVYTVGAEELEEFPFKLLDNSTETVNRIPPIMNQPKVSVVSKENKYRKDPSDSHSHSKSTINSWLQQGIRVKIISKKVEAGKVYLQKGCIVDIPSQSMALVRCDNGQLVEAKEKYLETVLPRIGESCMILAGVHRSEHAICRHRNDKLSKASVELCDSFDIIQVDFDDVAAIS